MEMLSFIFFRVLKKKSPCCIGTFTKMPLTLEDVPFNLSKGVK